VIVASANSTSPVGYAPSWRRSSEGGSVDICGNTEESWQRGMSYLISNGLLPRSPPQIGRSACAIVLDEAG